MAVPHQTARARSGELSIHYRRLGRPGGTPILIVHGLSYFSYDWLGVAQSLGAAREVVAMDMRGFGDSDWSPARDYSVPAMAQDIVNVLDHLRWPRTLLVGHSMGARSTTCVAAQHPDRVQGLVLVDYSPENAPAGARRTTEMVGNQPDAFPSIEAAMRYFSKDDRARFEVYLRKTDSGWAPKRDLYFRDQFRRTLQSGERPKLAVDMWQLLGEVRCPILSLRGARSDMYAAGTVEKMKAANPRLQVVEIPGAGHDIAGERPSELVSAFNKWNQAVLLEGAGHEHTGH
jgi:pimeloyl-ACP methyl ester carboxylesterase